MRRLAAIVALMLMAGLPSALHAVQPDEVMHDPAQEARARALSRELRCMVCQNQSIDDSEAPLARDQKIQHLLVVVARRDPLTHQKPQVARYGEFVLLK